MRERRGETGAFANACETKSGRMLISAVMTLALICLTAALYPITFLTNDDTSIMYALAGYYTGSPYPVHGFISLPLSYFTSALYTILPGVPWWPVLQLLAVGASIWIIFFSVMESGGRPLLSLGLNMTLYATVLVYAVARLSFTLTACMLGTAGVVRLLSADTRYAVEPRKMRGVYASSLALMALCFLFRNSTGYSLACFWAAAIVYHALNDLVDLQKPQKKNGLLRLGGYALAGVALFLSLVLLNGWAYANLNPPEYAAFDDARGRYADFPHVSYEEDPAFFASIGWDEETYDLVEQSCFLGGNVTADALNAIAGRAQTTQTGLTAKLSGALAYGEAFFRGNGPAEYMLVFPVIMVLWSTVWFFREKKRAVDALIVAGVALGAFALCFYLCIKQRLIVRSFQVIAVPMAAACLPLALRIRAENPPHIKKTAKTVFRSALMMLTLFALGWSAAKSWLWLGTYDPSELNANVRTVEAYAMEHTENAYIYAPRSLKNYEAFKTYPDEKPTNLIDWGDTGMYSGWKTLQIEQNGIESFTAEMFRQDDVYLLGKADASDLQVLLRYLQKHDGASGLETIDTIGTDYAVYHVVY